MERIDLSLKTSEDSRFRRKLTPMIKQLLMETHFKKAELICILTLHYKICQGKLMGRKLFRDVMGSMFNIGNEDMVERIYAAIEEPSTDGIGPMVWARLLSLFCRGTLDEKIIFCFTVYDNLNVGYISRGEIIKLLKETILAKPQDAEDSAADLADILTQKLDLDRDSKISFRDYRVAVRKNINLLQPFGKCLPDRQTCLTFMTTYTNLVSTMCDNYFEELCTMSECELRIYSKKRFAD